MSIPRDLKVEIPGYGTDKINAAYSLGGPKLTRQDDQGAALGLADQPRRQHQLRRLPRRGQRLGCVYIDVDRRYFNDNDRPAAQRSTTRRSTSSRATRSCAARTRWTTSATATSTPTSSARARQQDVPAPGQGPDRRRQLFGNAQELLRIFGRYTQTDIADVERRSCGCSSSRVRVRRAPGARGPVPGDSYERVLRHGHRRRHRAHRRASSCTRARKARRRGRRRKLTPDPTPRSPKKKPAKPSTQPRRSSRASPTATRRRGPGRDGVDSKLAVPDLLPQVRHHGSSRYARPARSGSTTIRDRAAQATAPTGSCVTRRGHRPVLGVQGTTWPTRRSSTTRTRRARSAAASTALLRRRRLRLVAWRTGNAVYWVSNTLLRRR